jgi:hypothetical protein
MDPEEQKGCAEPLYVGGQTVPGNADRPQGDSPKRCRSEVQPPRRVNGETREFVRFSASMLVVAPHWTSLMPEGQDTGRGTVADRTSS